MFSFVTFVFALLRAYLPGNLNPPSIPQVFPALNTRKIRKSIANGMLSRWAPKYLQAGAPYPGSYQLADAIVSMNTTPPNELKRTNHPSTRETPISNSLQATMRAHRYG